MTKKEQQVFIEWRNGIHDAEAMRTDMFEKMQRLYTDCGGGTPTCSLEYNLEYVLTSENRQTRNRALNIYANYIKANAEYVLIMKLGVAMANITNNSNNRS